MWVHVWQFVIGGLMLAAVAAWAVVPPTDRHLALFAHVYDVEVTPANRRLLAGAILWSRCWRIGGAVLAWGAVALIERITHDDRDWGLVPLAVGCAVGGTIGEWVRPRSAPSGQRRASLRPRSITDYVRPWVVVAILVLLGLSIICTAIYAALWPIEETPWPWAPRPIVLAGIVLGGLALTGATALVGTAVARRPQPTGDQSLDAAHHAVRSAALVSLSGNAMMAAAGTAYVAGVRVSNYGDGVVATLGSVATFGSMIGGFVGFMLAIRSIPRYAPFWRRLPAVPQAS